MDILLAGTLFSSLFMEFLCRVIVQRRYGLLRLVLWKTFRSKPNTIPVDEQNRNAVRNHNGMLFSFRPESRSPSTGFPMLIAWRLYLPEVWTQDKRRRKATGIPPEISFQL
jgi:hypothetical protein